MSTSKLRRFALRIHYDGHPWHGWQLQPRVPTVQGEIERVLEVMTGQRRAVVASGRTDRGVHATGQVASVDLPDRWQALELRRGMNALLHRSIWIEEVRRVPPDFHPRYHAVRRDYRYRVICGPGGGSPFRRPFGWALDPGTGRGSGLGVDLDASALHASAALLPGTRSFRRFARSGQPERGEVCIIHEASWRRHHDTGDASGWEFEIRANRFLHHMVRYLVGTMIALARGQRPTGDMAELLDHPETRLRTSPPAPPQGLYLSRVAYPAERWGDHPDRDPSSDSDPLQTGAPN